MSGLRTPVVIGLHPRAGTSTVAAVLHADEGAARARAADVVCVGEHAVSSALVLVTPHAGPRPVLAVGAGGVPGPPFRAPTARFGAVVVLPHLACWAGFPAPSEEIALLLGLPPEYLPQPLRAYAGALRTIAAAVVRSGQLGSGSPPMVLRPRVVPRGRPAPAADALDDDALEAIGGPTRWAAG